MKRLYRLIHFSLLTAAIVLMSLPNSTTMVFIAGPNLQTYNHYSFFSFMHLGYGDWGPGIAALFAVLAAVILIPVLIQRQPTPRLIRPARVFVIVSTAASLWTVVWSGVLSGIVNGYGIAVSVLLVMVAIGISLPGYRR